MPAHATQVTYPDAISDVRVTTTGDLNSMGGVLEVFADWSISTQASAGETFGMTLPEGMSMYGADKFDITLPDLKDEAIAKCEVKQKKLLCTLTNAVENHKEKTGGTFRGTLEMHVTISSVSFMNYVTEHKRLPFVISGGVTFVPINSAPTKPSLPSAIEALEAQAYPIEILEARDNPIVDAIKKPSKQAHGYSYSRENTTGEIFTAENLMMWTISIPGTIVHNAAVDQRPLAVDKLGKGHHYIDGNDFLPRVVMDRQRTSNDSVKGGVIPDNHYEVSWDRASFSLKVKDPEYFSPGYNYRIIYYTETDLPPKVGDKFENTVEVHPNESISHTYTYCVLSEILKRASGSGALFFTPDPAIALVRTVDHTEITAAGQEVT